MARANSQTQYPSWRLNGAMRAAFILANRKGDKVKALIFDTETTGLIENRTVHLDKQPHIIEFCGQIVDLATGEVIKKFTSLVKPSLPVDLSKPIKLGSPKTIEHITGISNAMIADAPSFRDIRSDIIHLIGAATSCIAHNLSYDRDMVEIEFARVKEKIAWPKKMVCTVEQTIHLRGHRLNLTKLYELLFPGKTFNAHRAGSDVDALTEAAVELHRRDII